MIFTNNKGQNAFVNMFIIFVTLIVFFALWPAVSAMIDLAVSVNAGTNATLDFLMGSIGFIIIFGLIKWVFTTASAPAQ